MKQKKKSAPPQIMNCLPMILDTFVALASDISLKKNKRTISCSVTAESEFKPDEIVLK